MKKILLRSTIVISLAALGVSVAQAEGGRQGGPRLPDFTQIDANNDGALTMDEFQNQAQAKFDGSDTNGDGLLDVAELTAAAARERGQRIERMIARKDTNGDGMLSVEEMQPRNVGQFFTRADADGNGEISQVEWDAAKAKMRERGSRGPQNPAAGN